MYITVTILVNVQLKLEISDNTKIHRLNSHDLIWAKPCFCMFWINMYDNLQYVHYHILVEYKAINYKSHCEWVIIFYSDSQSIYKFTLIVCCDHLLRWLSSNAHPFHCILHVIMSMVSYLPLESHSWCTSSTE